MLALTLANLVIVILVDFVKNKRKNTVSSEVEPPGYDAVTTQVRIVPESETTRR